MDGCEVQVEKNLSQGSLFAITDLEGCILMSASHTSDRYFLSSPLVVSKTYFLQFQFGVSALVCIVFPSRFVRDITHICMDFKII